MEIKQVGSNVFAVMRGDAGANSGLIKTTDGYILIDTTMFPVDCQAVLDEAGIQASDVRLVLLTHAHRDHVWGNQLFSCPIHAHRLGYETMKASMDGAWTPQGLEEMWKLDAKIDAERARVSRSKTKGMKITLPTDTFDHGYTLTHGGASIEVIPVGGHSPDSTFFWVPSASTLFVGDDIFANRYPFCHEADTPQWISVLQLMAAHQAKTIVPGHGDRCQASEINGLKEYLQDTWERVSTHVAKGHTVEETLSDPGFVVRPGWGHAERLHEPNIRAMYAQAQRQA